MSACLVRREFARLGDHVYVLHTYDNGTRWMIVQYPTRITARRVTGHFSDHAHHLDRPLGSDRTSSPAVHNAHTPPTPDEDR